MAKTKEELREARKQWFAPMEQKLQEMHTKEDDSLFRNPPSPLPKGAPPLPVVPHPQGRDKLKIAESNDFQSLSIARKACALKGERCLLICP